MKITRHQLIKIVKEEMSSVLQETAATDRMADDALRSIDTAVVETHELLPDEAQWIFEKNLENRIRKHLDQWRADRLFTDLDERELTKPESEEKERLVKGMKTDASDFEKRYPGRGEQVMHATATKLAKKRK